MEVKKVNNTTGIVLGQSLSSTTCRVFFFSNSYLQSTGLRKQALLLNKQLYVLDFSIASLPPRKSLLLYLPHFQGWLHLHDSTDLFLSHSKGCICLHDFGMFFLSCYQGCMLCASVYVILLFLLNHSQLNLFFIFWMLTVEG